jgi:hypothetical protein
MRFRRWQKACGAGLRDRPQLSAVKGVNRVMYRAGGTAIDFLAGADHRDELHHHYEWGDLSGDPRKFMERWFDLHLYLGNWRTRRLMIRVPQLLWLMAVQYELVADDEVEPLPGIGPLSDALEGFAEFFCIDRDLVQAAAERGVDDAAISNVERHKTLATIPEREKTELLLRVAEGDTHVAAELRNKLRKKSSAPTAHRTVGALRMRAGEIAEGREGANAERREAERRRQVEEAEKARRVRLKALKQRGVGVWREIEAEIERRNASGYDKAAGLLSDLEALAAQEGSQSEFARRLASIRVRLETKRKFIERLTKLRRDSDERRL